MSLPTQVAETVQTAHINRNPSPEHDINPSTAASRKEPVQLRKPKAKAGPNSSDDGGSIDDDEFVAGDDGDVDDELETEEEDLYRAQSVKPRPRRHKLPPMPDLRFEQSYLWSIRNADTWWKVGWITVRDQVMMPFTQGIVYNLGICGWHYWNRNAQIHGSSIGARLRRWWYGVNNWAIPPERKIKRWR
ncbi:hypothetical protein B0J18DRAFT_465528 [Chaetomium sp. MPI-SDFR-AT-0129]|nr:hypothetical protein B0J18DRAFT_465528 [Chaetomium sp. MPI-SDFR-AT-0129]